MTKRKIIATYAAEANTYDRTRAIFEKGRFAGRERKLYSQYLRRGSKILIVACGTGRHFKYLCTEIGAEVVGLDVSVAMLRIARTKERSVALIRGDAENLPFRDGAFDAILCSRAFYLFDNKFSFLRSAYSAVKMRGKVLVSTISKGTFITRFGVKVKLLEADPETYPYDAKDLRSMLTSVAFKCVHTRCIVLFTHHPLVSFLPKIVLYLIEGLEQLSSEGRWVLVVGQKPCI